MRDYHWREYLRKYFANWLNRRIPASKKIRLDRRRIFIMPSRVGAFFFLCLLVMLLAAINYQNNMSYALTFLLATLFVVAILHTYANLAGVSLHALRAASAFPGQVTEFDVRVDGGGRERHCLRLCWPDSSEQTITLLDNNSEDIRLFCSVGSRGWFRPGRLLIESHFPLGLLRCWSWVDLDLCALVYPEPHKCRQLPGSGDNSEQGHALVMCGNDDFFGFQAYRAGDSLRQIYWKGYAKGQGLQSKHYTAYSSSNVWLDFDAFAGVSVEMRLSYLCYLVLMLDTQQQDYGLRLPGLELLPDRGERHRDKVLSALALYGLGDIGQ
ncbi:MAG: DUF58 domain-containing protein [Parahaliea sp.]